MITYHETATLCERAAEIAARNHALADAPQL